MRSTVVYLYRAVKMDNVISIEHVYQTRTLADVKARAVRRRKKRLKDLEEKQRTEDNTRILRNLGLLKPKTK